MPLTTKDLDECRARMDELDLQLVRILNARAACAEQIGRIKSGLGIDAYSPEREQQVLHNVTQNNPGPLSADAVRRLFKRIINESRAVERVMMDRLSRDVRPPSKQS